MRRLIPVAVVLGVVAVIFIILAIINRYSIEFTIPAEETITHECGDPYDSSDIKAYFSGTIFHRKQTEVPVEESGTIDVSTPGTYTLTYSASKGRTQGEAVRTVIVQDTTPPEIILTEVAGSYTLPGQPYEEQGYIATDICDGDVTALVTSEERDGSVYYTVTDSHGNTGETVRKIIYNDPEPPVLTVDAADAITAEAGVAFSVPGYYAVDNVDGDITASVQITNMPDTSVPGVYYLTYTVSDAFGNTTEKVIQVTVADTQGPVITLGGNGAAYVQVGSAYTEPGYSAVDLLDGDVTANVAVSGGVDVNTPGEYSVTYTVYDSTGNASSAVRKVYVYKVQTEVSAGDKVIYLTFDDGPGAYTEQLLNVLAKYNVKVTFFVTAQASIYLPLLKRESDEGHTVAVHSYTHRYETIYASEDAFYADINQMRDTVAQYTGKVPTILRFPGGTSNTVSRNYCTGIMTALSQSAPAKGWKYMDWNVSSQDAAGATTAAEVAQNVIAGCTGKSQSVVLQHDIFSYSVDAVEQIIQWGLANGYTFLPITESTPSIHFTPEN